jgi:hypothetical protein
MICLRNICVNTLHKGDSIFTYNNNNNNNNNEANIPNHQATCIGGKDKGPTILRLGIRRIEGPYHEADIVSRVREFHLMEQFETGAFRERQRGGGNHKNEKELIYEYD